MVAPRLTRTFRAVPLAFLATLEAWLLIDLLTLGDLRWIAAVGLLWFANLVMFALATSFRWLWARWVALILLGGSYVGIHAVALGVALVPALGFISLLIAHVELRILAERFAPLFFASVKPEERRRIGGTLFRAVLRVAIASVLSIVVPLLAADLAAVGVVPLTSIPTAFLLAAALVAVIVLLALLPAMEQRAVASRSSTRGAKDN
jgi:hypothetical protein